MLTLLSGLLPTLLKALPVFAAGILYLLWKRERAKRRIAEEERAGAEASYEVAQEAIEIREEERKLEDKVDQMGLGELANVYHTGVCSPDPEED